MAYTLSELINGLDVDLKGDPACVIHGVSTIQDSKPGQISFLINPRYKKYLPHTKASAVVLNKANLELCQTNAIVCDNPHYVYAKIAEFFKLKEAMDSGVHDSVVISKNVTIASTARIGANCVIGNNVRIEDEVVIGPGCVIGDAVSIDVGSHLDANVTIYDKVKIGKRAKLASGVVIGCDGFGFANQKNRWHKIPQLGSVIIGDDVDIGANTTIDRGAIEDTIIADGVKLDNLIQVGHNVEIGENTIIAGCVGIAGSTIIGKNCMIGGASNFAGHIQICDNVIITGETAVTKSITEPGIYSSGIVGVVTNQEFRKNNARFHRLDQLMQRVKQVEMSFKTIERKKS